MDSPKSRLQFPSDGGVQEAKDSMMNQRSGGKKGSFKIKAHQAMTPVGKMAANSETPTNLSIPLGFFVLDKPIKRHIVAQLVKERVLTHPGFKFRMSSSVSENGQFTMWESQSFLDECVVAYKDLDDALENLFCGPSVHFDGADDAQGPQSDEQKLATVISALGSRDLIRSRPLWQLTVIERYGEGSCVICRVHHCLADGLSLGTLAMLLSDDGVPSEVAKSPSTQLDPESSSSASSSGSNWSLSGSWRSWSELGALALQTALLAMAAVMVLLKWTWLLLACDKLHFLRTEQAREGSSRRRLVWDSSLSVQSLKAAGRTIKKRNTSAKHYTVNDVALAMIASGLDKYSDQTPLTPGKRTRRAKKMLVAVPMNLRSGIDSVEMRNKFGFALLALGLKGARPDLRLVDRAADAHQAMRFCKTYHENQVAFMLATFASTLTSIHERVGTWMLNEAMWATTQNISVCVSNVPGPPNKIKLNGANVTNMMGFVPPPSGVRLGIGIFSYAGKVNITVSADELVIQDPEVLLQRIVESSQGFF